MRTFTITSPCCDADIAIVQKAVVYYTAEAYCEDDECKSIKFLEGSLDTLEPQGRQVFECGACGKRYSPAELRKLARQQRPQASKDELLYEGFRKMAGVE